MRDEETQSLWDHITGECFEGSLTGNQLSFWPVYLTTVLAERTQHPETILLQSNHRSLQSLFLDKVLIRQGVIHKEKTILAPNFRRSMSGEIDARLPEHEQGLGIMSEQNEGKFYPMKVIPKTGIIEDKWQGRKLVIERNALDGVPFARWVDADEPPMQLLTRWYGFSFTYPNCEIYE